MKRVEATFEVHETRTLELVIDDDAGTDGDLLSAAAEVEPWTDFWNVLEWHELDA